MLKQQNPNLKLLLDALDPAQMGSLLMKEWNLPDIVWQSAAFQRYPEFSPPSKVASGIRPNVALLYMAQMCHGFLMGLHENEMPTTFLERYKVLLKWEKISLKHIVRNLLLANLSKKIKSFPTSFRLLIRKNAKPEK